VHAGKEGAGRYLKENVERTGRSGRRQTLETLTSRAKTTGGDLKPPKREKSVYRGREVMVHRENRLDPAKMGIRDPRKYVRVCDQAGRRC